MDVEEAKQLLKTQQEQDAKEFLDRYQQLVEETGFECVILPQMIEVQPGAYAFKPQLGIRPVNGRDT